MAGEATFVEEGKHVVGGMTFHHVKATIGAGTTAVYTIPQTGTSIPAFVRGLSFPFKTTGSAAACTATHALSTGVLTLSGFTNTDVIRFTLIY